MSGNIQIRYDNLGPAAADLNLLEASLSGGLSQNIVIEYSKGPMRQATLDALEELKVLEATLAAHVAETKTFLIECGVVFRELDSGLAMKLGELG